MAARSVTKRAPEPELVPLKEVCVRLGVHVNTAYLMIGEERFPIKTYRIRGRWKCRKIDVDKFFTAA